MALGLNMERGVLARRKGAMSGVFRSLDRQTRSASGTMDREDAIPPSAGSGRAPRLPRVLGRKQGAPQEERQRSRANEAPQDLGHWLRE